MIPFGLPYTVSPLFSLILFISLLLPFYLSVCVLSLLYVTGLFHRARFFVSLPSDLSHFLPLILPAIYALYGILYYTLLFLLSSHSYFLHPRFAWPTPRANWVDTPESLLSLRTISSSLPLSEGFCSLYTPVAILTTLCLPVSGVLYITIRCVISMVITSVFKL